MATKKSTSGSTTKPKTMTRLPPVAERVTVTLPIAVPSKVAAAPPPPPAAPAPVQAPAASPPAAPSPTAAPSQGAAQAPALDQPVAPPPPAMIPTVPNGYSPANPADLKGYRATASQIAVLPDAVSELAVFTSYSQVFGITAPDPVQLLDRLEVALQWTMLLSQTAAWYKYAKSQQGLAWKDAILMADALKAPFTLALAANPALLNQYPAVAKLLQAKAASAKRAATTRAKNKKVAATAAASADGATPSPAPAAPAPAAPAAMAVPVAVTPEAPAATRIVTVQG